MKLLCVLKIVKCGVLSDLVWRVSLQNLEINYLWSVHVAVRQCAKLLKITLFHSFFCMFCNAANTSKSQNTSHIKETVLENLDFFLDNFGFFPR